MATNVATIEETNKALAIPDWMQGDRGLGTEDITSDDVATPRLALLQALSPQVSAGEGRPGDFYHLLSEENLGRDVEIVPIIVAKSFLLWKPRDQGGGLLARADDGIHWNPPNAEFNLKVNNKEVTWRTASTVAASGLDKWGSAIPGDPQSLPAATKLMNVLVWLPQRPDLSPSVISLQRSSLKPGKKFLGKLKMSAAPTFGLRFRMTSEKVQGPKGEFMAPVFTGAGFVEDKALYMQLKEMHDHFRAVGVRVREDGLQDEEDTDSSIDETKF